MNRALQVLALLERFRFMTREQMQKSGLDGSADHVGEVLRGLSRRKLIGVVRPGVAPGIGRLAFVYYLREPGAVLLAEAQRRDLEALTWCASEPQLTHDLAHRLACVDVHRWLVRVFDSALVEFLPYYTMSRVDEGMRHSSRLVIDGKAFVPDALFVVEKQEERFGYVVEVQRAKRSGELREQVAKLAHAVRDGIAARRLGVPAVGVMFVVENQRDLKVIREAASSMSPLRGALFGRTLESLDEANKFTEGWEALA